MESDYLPPKFEDMKSTRVAYNIFDGCVSQILCVKEGHEEKYENMYEPGVVGSELLGTVEFLGQLILKKWLVPQNIRSPFRNTVALDTSFPLMQVLAPIKSKMHVNNVFSA